MDIGELKTLIARHENENIELKDWGSLFSILGKGDQRSKNKCLLGYCVGLGNEGGGRLIVGVQNNLNIVGTSANININEVKKSIYDHTGQKIEIEEIFDGKKKIILFTIPPRPVGALLKFHGVPLMRIGESLEMMSDEEQCRILLEGQDDFSARLCKESSIKDVDLNALAKLRVLYQEKHKGNKLMEAVSNEQFLTDLALMREGKLTNAGVVLLARRDFLDLHSANAEISFEYRNDKNNLEYNERRDYRDPFVLVVSEIWEKIASRQQVHPFIDGLFRREISAFNEEVIREALFNAVCHRDYTQRGSIFIKQSPEEFEIISPGGFPHGISAENIISAPSNPRNRLLAEVFQKVLPGVERSGQGADKIFRTTIAEGKGEPSYKESTKYNVRLIIPATLQDSNFVKYLEKISNENQSSLSINQILLLEKIRKGDQEGVNLKSIGELVDKGFVEVHGKTRGAKYILASRYYTETGKLGERTRRIGLSRDKRKELLLEHLRTNNQGGTMSEFRQIFPELKTYDINNLLAELKKDKKIYRQGSARKSVWKIYS